MSRRPHWMAIVAALALLGGNTASEQALRHALGDSKEAALGRAGSAETEAGERTRITAVLQVRNPLLGEVTSERIADAVLRCGRDHGLSPRIVLAVLLAESSAVPSARSPKGAIGLMQVMPHMFEELALPGNVAHIEANVEAGCLLLADNIRRLGEADGISAYFWGSQIRGDAYLQRVRGILKDLAFELDAEAARGRG